MHVSLCLCPPVLGYFFDKAPNRCFLCGCLPLLGSWLLGSAGLQSHLLIVGLGRVQYPVNKGLEEREFQVFGRHAESGLMCRLTCKDCMRTFPNGARVCAFCASVLSAEHLPVLFLSLSYVFFTYGTPGMVSHMTLFYCLASAHP